MSSLGGGGFRSPWSSQTELEMEPLSELGEAGFEPQTRARSNTWPQPRPDNFVEPETPGSNKNSNQHLPSAGGAPPLPIPGAGSTKKNSSRRNAWGNLSYADLITQAITSAPENRLTLSQIYEWMVQNVPYFKDKGDSNSSAGWKNSIRHNLSLHNRFMRVQNEGTGKSSWWMINPDAKPGKAVRRRAASMETSKFEKKRGRVKKKAETLRNGITADATPSPSSSVSEGLDMFPDSPLHSGGYQLSPQQDFRQRASSNASSCGRMSPLPSLISTDSDWNTDYLTAGEFKQEYQDFSNCDPYHPAEQLAGSLADTMKLHTTDPFLSSYPPTTSSGGVGPTYAYGGAYGGCNALYPAHPAHAPAPRHHSLDHFVCPPPPADSADILRRGSGSQMLSQEQSLLSSGVMIQGGAMGPTTVMGQLMGALNHANNAAIIEDLNLNIESLEHGRFDCNVEEVINHELSMEQTPLDFNFSQQQQAAAAAAAAQGASENFSAPAPPSAHAPHVPVTHQNSPRAPYPASPSWVH